MRCGRFTLPALLTAMLVLTAGPQSSLTNAQTFRAATRRLAFEVLSIKASQPGSPGRVGWKGDRVFIDGATGHSLIGHAYAVRPWEMTGSPQWASRERYDIVARLEDSGEMPPLAETFRALLAQSFDFRARYEQQEQQTYRLVVSPTGLGPQLRRYDLDCAAYVAADPQSAVVMARTTRPTNGVSPCSFVRGNGQITSGGTTMPVLAGRLADLVGRVVIDDTRLTGYYELTLDYPARDSTIAPDAGVSEGDRRKVMTAVQEQLGLILEPRQQRIQILVIERLRRPALR